MSHKVVLRYLERKTEARGKKHLADKGPAWIARVVLSKSGRSLYFGRYGIKLMKGGVYGNCFDMKTGDEWWVSGVKKDGLDRHWTGSGKVLIESGAVEEYLKIIGEEKLDKSKFHVVPDFGPPDIARFHKQENELLDPAASAEFYPKSR